MELVELTEAHRKEIQDLLMREPHTHLYQIERLKIAILIKQMMSGEQYILISINCIISFRWTLEKWR